MIGLFLVLTVVTQTDPTPRAQPNATDRAPVPEATDGGSPSVAEGAASAVKAGASAAAKEIAQAPKLRWDPRIDIPVSGALVVGWVLSEFVVKKPLAPKACRWCETNSFDTSFRALFNPNRTPSAFGISGADTASYMTGMVALPIAMLGFDALWAYLGGGTPMDWLVDTLVMIEASFSSLAFSQTTKYIAGRARPYTVDAPQELLATARDPTDHWVSFFSGHTTFAFSLAVSAGMTASLRHYKYAWVTWASGLGLASATMVLRMAADKHWASDVLVAMAVGTACGIAVPLLFHDQQGQPMVNVGVMPNGVSVSGRF